MSNADFGRSTRPSIRNDQHLSGTRTTVEQQVEGTHTPLKTGKTLGIPRMLKTQMPYIDTSCLQHIHAEILS